MKKNKAFTLIEVLLVLVLMGIILGIAAPNFSKGYSDFQLKRTVDDLMDISRWAQAMAVSRGHSLALVFSEDRRSYDVQQVLVNEETSEESGFKAVPGPLGRKHYIPGSVNLETNRRSIKFYSDGLIDPATVHLGSKKQTITLSSAVVIGRMTRVNE
ncbi:MAG: prepilin-type N-terminal cleavage/methylation domain-containing protein [Candidatus Omnitrophica bacterium]|nr:prepilin-type N-terminal cleavage/methylation domain-containing protein [Candidatus Omnitrophota bacterium]